MTLDYQILLTPLINPDEYGETIDISKDIDISDFIINGGINQISRELDQGDYDIGVFNYGSISMKVNNYDGKFNARSEDSRSLFPWNRDRAKVLINFFSPVGTISISFRGLLADKATRHNITNQTIKFVFLSTDSILQQDSVDDGAITNGMSFTDAFRVILDVPFVTNVLNYNQSDINPNLNLIIDDGSKFNTLLRKNAIDSLLSASNSVMIIDESNDIIIKDRSENMNTPHELFLNDQFKRNNIDAIPSYNNGLQRMFNSVIVNNQELKNVISIKEYAVRQKSFSFNFITNDVTAQTIADAILLDFGFPKSEIDIIVETDFAKTIKFSDVATIDINHQLQKDDGVNLGIYDIDSYNKSKYAIEVGSFKIDGRKKWKTIGFFENPKNYKTKIRFRDTGGII